MEQIEKSYDCSFGCEMMTLETKLFITFLNA